jgi:hypothetical protein
MAVAERQLGSADGLGRLLPRLPPLLSAPGGTLARRAGVASPVSSATSASHA